MNVNDLLKRQREISDKINLIADQKSAAKREYTADEKSELLSLNAEFKKNEREITILNQKAEAERANRKPAVTNDAAFREFLKTAKAGESVVLSRSYTGISETGLTNNSGIGLTIKDVLPPEDYGLVYDKVGAPIQTNVHGNIQWPVAGYVEATINGETDTASDQTIDLNAITAVQNRLTVRIKVSNAAINDINYDLLGFVRQQAQAGIYRKLNHALCSSTKVATNFYGPFAHSNVQTTTFPNGGFTLTKAMEMVGMVADLGFNGDHVGFVMSPAEFYKLKATPVDSGSGLMIIDSQNKLAGFPVAVSRDMTQAARGTKTATEIIGCGDFAYLPINQHGDIRVSVDNSSSDAAAEDVTIITINSYWSLTHLKPTAFVKATEASA